MSRISGPSSVGIPKAIGLVPRIGLMPPSGATAPSAAKILVDAFARFNIPYQSGIAADDNIPDTATVELFVAKKP